MEIMNKILILICFLSSISIAQSSSKYFIYFNDKGIDKNSVLQKESNKYQEAKNSLSERSIKRRMKTLGKDFITFEDLPINENYIFQIEKNNVKIIHKLKWLNAVSTIITDQQYQEISKYNFVSKIEKVKKLKYRNDKSTSITTSE